jgi:hypothetical protein
MFDVNNSNLCPICKLNGHYIKLELTESMLLVCKQCSRAFEVKSNGKRMLFYGGDDKLILKNNLPEFNHK